MKTLYQLKNEDRILEFVGEKIAHVSSENNDSIRWLEVNIYATESGGYVYETIGRSVVFRPRPAARSRSTGSGSSVRWSPSAG